MSDPQPLSPAKPPASFDLTGVFILLAAGLAVGIITQRDALIYSPNDASRWDTVYYLVEHGTFEFMPGIDVPWAQRWGPTAKMSWAKETDPRVWDLPVFWTIDMIRVDGKYYSSKPPLLPTCVAGIVWAAQKVTGQTFHENPWLMERIVLVLVQVLPFVVFLLLLRHHVWRLTDSPYARNFCMAAAAFGTYLTPWLITFNNHVIAAGTAMVAVHAAIRIWYDGKRQWWWFAIAGFFAAFTASIELPAGLLAVALFVALLVRDYRRTLTAGLIAAAIPTAAALYTNYLVTGSLSPAYASIGDKAGFYDYPGSYWRHETGIDALAEPKHVYLAHMLVGHDGFFILTPILVVCLVGLILHLRRPRTGSSDLDRLAADPTAPPGAAPPDRRLLAAFVLLLSLAIVAVYTATTNNYGGGCQGFRWLFWLVPFWLMFLPAGVEWLSRTSLGSAICHACLLVSAYSAAYALGNPWASTWVRVLFRNWGWINY